MGLISNFKAQMKIQQMAFMILAVFFFFVLVGIFFVGISLNNLTKDVERLQKEQAISSLEVIADMPEFNCGSSERLCLDEDKIKIMSGDFGKDYASFWPIASIDVIKVYPSLGGELRKCPDVDCNYFEVYKNEQNSTKTYSTFVSLCKKVKESNYPYDRCEIAKLRVGVEINE